MKNAILLTLVLTMASLAVAVLTIEGYDGSPLTESDIITLEIWGDGQEQVNHSLWLCVLSGPGTLDVESAQMFIPPPPDSMVIDLGDLLGQQTIMFGPVEAFFSTQINGPIFYDGLVASIDIHCEGPGDVVLDLRNGDDPYNIIYDEITITQVPEPASLSLLALSGLLARRKR